MPRLDGHANPAPPPTGENPAVNPVGRPFSSPSWPGSRLRPALGNFLCVLGFGRVDLVIGIPPEEQKNVSVKDAPNTVFP